MTISLKAILLFLAIFLTGLSAGLFYAWAVSVIPGTQKISDNAYLEAMQSINRAILNPVFYLSFMGSLLFLSLASITQYKSGLTFWLILFATILYLAGTFGVTVFGNVPLNDQLEALDLTQLGADQKAAFRAQYEVTWNRLHMIRTIFSLVAFGLSLLSAFSITEST